MYASPGASISEITAKVGQCSTRTEAESNPGLPGDTGGNHRAFHRFKVDQPVTTASQVGTVTESPAQSTTLAAREVVAQKPNTEEMPPVQDGRSKPDKLNHHGCKYGGIHTDACWNDPRWEESNKAHKVLLADTIANGHYKLLRKSKLEIFNGKYKYVSNIYADWYKEHHYCNHKITRCSDGEVLVNLDRDETVPLWECLNRKGEDWFAICNSYPVLVNLTTNEIFEQRGDHYYPDDLTWYTVEVSPDGNTLLASGSVDERSCHIPTVNQFYDFSHPERGFRQLPPVSLEEPDSSVWLEDPDWDDEDIEWDTDQDNKTTVTLVITSYNFDDDKYGNGQRRTCCGNPRYWPPVYRVTLRHEGNQMVEINRKPFVEK